MHLIDLNDLARPGDGRPRDEVWATFVEDARIKGLGWPELVVQQFLFDHGMKDEFLRQYGHLDLETLRWDTRDLVADEFVGLSVFEDFEPWVEASAALHESRVTQRPTDQRLAWIRQGTWIVAPVLIDGSLLAPPRSSLHLVEGHTRVGILLGRVAAGAADPDRTHEVFVGRLDIGVDHVAA
jgi:hypothetical protein